MSPLCAEVIDAFLARHYFGDEKAACRGWKVARNKRRAVFRIQCAPFKIRGGVHKEKTRQQQQPRGVLNFQSYRDDDVCANNAVLVIKHLLNWSRACVYT